MARKKKVSETVKKKIRAFLDDMELLRLDSDKSWPLFMEKYPKFEGKVDRGQYGRIRSGKWNAWLRKHPEDAPPKPAGTDVKTPEVKQPGTTPSGTPSTTSKTGVTARTNPPVQLGLNQPPGTVLNHSVQPGRSVNPPVDPTATVNTSGGFPPAGAPMGAGGGGQGALVQSKYEGYLMNPKYPDYLVNPNYPDYLVDPRYPDYFLDPRTGQYLTVNQLPPQRAPPGRLGVRDLGGLGDDGWEEYPRQPHKKGPRRDMTDDGRMRNLIRYMTPEQIRSLLGGSGVKAQEVLEDPMLKTFQLMDRDMSISARSLGWFKRTNLWSIRV